MNQIQPQGERKTSSDLSHNAMFARPTMPQYAEQKHGPQGFAVVNDELHQQSMNAMPREHGKGHAHNSGEMGPGQHTE